ncbi:MAG: ral secretion pathway protein [Geobacteraceae bacterium]|nr:ral secretion pathway protein [Geobacteraceae bacterium]
MDLLILDMTRSSILALEFHAGPRAVSFRKAAQYQLAEGEALDSLLNSFAASDAAKGTIILCLDPAAFFYREMEFPLNDRRKIREILPVELKGETAVDTDESVFDAIPLEGGKFLVAWGKRKHLAAHIECMTRAGIEPKIVTCAPFHWNSLLAETTAGGHAALSDGSALAVYHGRELVYLRALGEGELAREIGKTLAALEMDKGISVEQVFLFGDAAVNCPGVEAPETSGLPEFCPLPIAGRLAEAFSGNAVSALELAGTWALALEAASGTPVNFRYGELAYTAGFEKARKKLRLSAILASLCILLLFAESGIRYYLVKKDVDSLNNSISTMYREVFPTRKKPVDEVAELKSEIRRMGGDSGSQNLLASLKNIAEIKGDGITGFYEAEFDGNQVRLKGDAVSFQAVTDFKMRAGALFASAEVGEIKSRAGGGVSFSFRGTSQEAGK